MFLYLRRIVQFQNVRICTNQKVRRRLVAHAAQCYSDNHTPSLKRSCNQQMWHSRIMSRFKVYLHSQYSRRLLLIHQPHICCLPCYLDNVRRVYLLYFRAQGKGMSIKSVITSGYDYHFCCRYTDSKSANKHLQRQMVEHLIYRCIVKLGSLNDGFAVQPSSVCSRNFCNILRLRHVLPISISIDLTSCL